jgi:Leu/Phe-tRNA-protein transferase
MDFYKTIEQAKEMEKQNIIESYCQGCFDMWKDNGIVPRETSEDYYNRTFKSE